MPASPSTTASPTDPPPCHACGRPIEAGRWQDALAAVARWPQFCAYLHLTTCEACSANADDDPIEVRYRTSAERAALRVQASGLPPALHGLQLDDIDTADGRDVIVAQLRRWASEGGGLYLCGPVGTGKTKMAAAAAWAALQLRKVRWASVPALTIAYQAAFGDLERKEAMQTLIGAGALVLDDLGHERATEDVTAQLHAAIDNRVAAGAPLLITSNFTPSELGVRHGDWLPSRIQGYCVSMRVLGRDRRLDVPVSDPEES